MDYIHTYFTVFAFAPFQPVFNKFIRSSYTYMAYLNDSSKMHPFVHMGYSVETFIFAKMIQSLACLCLLDALCELLHMTGVFINCELLQNWIALEP